MIRMQLTNLLTLAAVFATACTYAGDPAALKATVSEVQVPERVFTNATGGIVVDFGKDAFGWLEIDAPAAGLDYFLNIGEVLRETTGHVDRKPGPCVRARGVKWHTEKAGFQRVPVAPDLRNLFTAGEGSPARLPEKYGVVTPFRAVEFYQADFPVTAQTVRRHVITYPADRNESSFSCDDAKLVKVYDFCKYSILATSFAGLYVDGDRERVPYEGDAYINQLSQYAISSDERLSRASHEYLLRHPTWPTEWKQHSVMMAWTDWMWTGSTESLTRTYDVLKNEKLLLSRARPDGLLTSPGEALTGPNRECDLIDWPPRDRDGYVFRPVSAVVNAFHYRNLGQMADMARALSKAEDAAFFADRATRVRAAYMRVFRDPADGLYRDGEGTDHKGFHAQVAALAFGLVPDAEKRRVAETLVRRGMVCSVYYAQYLLEALYAAGCEKEALALMVSDSDRSWLGMLRQGATITMEAWNLYDKPNLDWNHAWGTPPLNIISRYVLGVTPLEPGFAKISVKPQVGGLRQMKGLVPTTRGAVKVDVDGDALKVTVPAQAVVTWRGKVHHVQPGEHVFWGDKFRPVSVNRDRSNRCLCRNEP